MEDVVSFRGVHKFLSNFYPAQISFDGYIYRSVEYAYQAAKTTDKKERHTVRFAATPGVAKSIGKRLTLRPDWEDVKLSIMYHLLKQKFNEPTLKALLLRTRSRVLIEGNTWGDTYWGQCPIGNGDNNLGLLLMDIRKELRNERP